MSSCHNSGGKSTQSFLYCESKNVDLHLRKEDYFMSQLMLDFLGKVEIAVEFLISYFSGFDCSHACNRNVVRFKALLLSKITPAPEIRALETD